VDRRLIAVVALVWAALAAAYDLVPALHMPAGVRLWGFGALVFLGLWLAMTRAAERNRRGGDR